MRDVLIVAIVLYAGVTALRKPWIGILLWTWLSIMNPHRYTWGFAYTAPLAAFAAGTIAIGFGMTRERHSPFQGSASIWLVAFMIWMTLSWLLGLDAAGDYEQWKKVIKIDVMIIAALALLQWTVARLSVSWPWFRDLVRSRPALLVEEGRYREERHGVPGVGSCSRWLYGVRGVCAHVPPRGAHSWGVWIQGSPGAGTGALPG